MLSWRFYSILSPCYIIPREPTGGAWATIAAQSAAHQGCGGQDRQGKVVVWRVEFQFPLPKTNMAPENEALEKEIPIRQQPSF